MKKLFSIILSLALIMSMSMTAFAADVEADGGSASADVTGTYNAGSDSETVFSVDIVWSGLSFTYNEGGKSWNAGTHSYDTTEAGWAESNASITVTNHSNTAITATPTWTAADGYGDVTMSFANESGAEITYLALATADNGTDGAAGTATSGIIKVTPGGTLAATANNVTIGTITVTISASAIVVSDEAALAAALAAGGNIVLADDISLTSTLTVSATTPVVLDLNGNTITLSAEDWALVVNEGSTLTLNDSDGNGSIKSSGATVYCYGTLIVNGGTYDSGMGRRTLLVNSTGNAVINGGTFTWIAVNGTLTMTGGTITSGLEANGTITVTGGTFPFDVSKYVDIENYDVITNDDGTYTVTAKTA